MVTIGLMSNYSVTPSPPPPHNHNVLYSGYIWRDFGESLIFVFLANFNLVNW